MADKLIQITVKATTRDAEANLPKVTKVLKDLEDQAKRTATATLGLEDLGTRFKRLGRDVEGLTAEAADFREEIEKDTEGLSAMSRAARAAGEAAVFLGVGFAALKLAEKAIDLARVAAASSALRDSFQDLSASSQIDSQILLDSLDKAAKGTVSDLELMKAANAAWYLGISQNVAQYTDLMKIAEEKSKDLGVSTSEYWSRLTTAIASSEPVALRQLGIIIDNERAYQNYAVSIGKAADELTEQDQIQARVNAVIADGELVLRDWESAEIDATTVTQQFDAATANLRDTIKEGLLPVLIPAIQWITRGLEGIDAGMAGQNQTMAELIKVTGSAALAEEEFAKRIEIASQGMIDQGEAARIAHIAMVDYRIDLIGIDKGIQEDIRAMRMGSEATSRLGDDQKELADSTDDAAKAAERAASTWRNYLVAVERRNVQFTSRMEDMAVRQTQAAEGAAFRLFEIERDAGQRRDDLLNKQWLDELNELERHQMKMRWTRQDYLDDLRDMEYDYQQEKGELLDQAGWWVRNALGKEFAEREKIARSGDKKALAEYDKVLLEKIKAVDPAYAKQLRKLQNQYNHEKAIEQREFKQGNRRQEEQYAQEGRAQERQLGLQLSVLERELVDQRQAWEFHDRQRLENETRAMEELRRDHAYQLETMREDVEYRLGTIPDLWKHAGYASWVAFLQGFNDAQGDYGFTPATGYDPANFVNPFAASAQFGMDYVPRTMQMTIHQGEAILPAREAERYRAGPITIGELHLHGNYTPFLAQKMARELADELGPMYNQRSR